MGSVPLQNLIGAMLMRDGRPDVAQLLCFPWWFHAECLEPLMLDEVDDEDVTLTMARTIHTVEAQHKLAEFSVSWLVAAPNAARNLPRLSPAGQGRCRSRWRRVDL